MSKDRIQEPIGVRLAEALQACVDELNEFRPESRDTIDWAEDVLVAYRLYKGYGGGTCEI
jgi:hypothetical protein